MSVISITITESSIQKVAGIPITVVLTTNVPATIFYTLDGTTPTTSSTVVTGPIELPTDQQTIVLKAFATDGVTSCPVVTQSYGSSTATQRQAHDEISGLNDVTKGATYPFGSQDQGGPGIYGNIARDVNRTVDDPNIAGIPDSFDGTGTGTYANETDLPLTDYDFRFSETNAIGQRGKGIGTLPAEVTVEIPDPIQETSVPSSGSSDTNSPFFNPKSLVIFQDGSEEPFDSAVTSVNKPYFDMQDPERARDGGLFTTTALEGNVPQGSSLIQRFNPRDNTITFYYFDSTVNRWIISKEPFTPRKANLFNYSQVVFGRDQGAGRVFHWLPFHYRTLTI